MSATGDVQNLNDDGAVGHGPERTVKDDPAARSQSRAAERVRDQIQDRENAGGGGRESAQGPGSGSPSTPRQSTPSAASRASGSTTTGASPRPAGPGADGEAGDRAARRARSAEGELPQPRTSRPRPPSDRTRTRGAMRHIFGQIERHTVFGDLGTGQGVALAIALVATVVALVSGQSVVHLLLAGGCAAAGAWVAFGRVRQRRLTMAQLPTTRNHTHELIVTRPYFGGRSLFQDPDHAELLDASRELACGHLPHEHKGTGACSPC